MSKKGKIRTVDDVAQKVRKIKKWAYHREKAHILDDELRESVLEFITSDECVDLTQAKAMATEALRTNEHIEIRWYA